jgi:ubiquinone/menaquinone biosynthesis C-methylase UbiE
MTKIISMLEQFRTGKILDVATGNGNFLKFLTDTLSDYSKAVGIDTKPEVAGAFEATFQQNPKVHFLVIPAEKMDFEDSSFDIVCISNSLHHLADPKRVLHEMLRVLSPGGIFILNEMYHDGDQAPTQQTHILLHHWFAAVDRAQNLIHNETYTRQELIDFTAGLQLELLDTEDQIDLSEDPHNPEIYSELDPIIQRYIQRAEGSQELQEQGKRLQERLRSIGFHSASSLLLMAGKK